MLTTDQIRFFHENGYLIQRGVFQGEELRLLTEAVNDVQAQGIAKIGEQHLYSSSGVYWRSENLWNRGDIFRAVAVHPELLENIGQCVGDTFFPWNDSLVVKLPNNGMEVAWHQDPPYYTETSRETTFAIPNFTTDIYLDHSGPDNGCVWAIPGRHLVGHVDLTSRTAKELMYECGAKPLEMEAGDVLFHALSTPHGSAINTSDIQRRIFYIHYVNEAVYQDGYGSASWAKSKPGWGDERKAIVDSMLELRQQFGWETPESRETLTYGNGGFRFVGKPSTPPSYWGTLSSAISEAERVRLKVV